MERRFVRDEASFEQVVRRGTPTYVFKLPTHLGGRDLYVAVLTGEGLQHLFSRENIVELGRRKGTYLLDPSAVAAASPAEERIASHPIELRLHRDDIRIADRSPQDRVIYFYHSVIAAHETAAGLRSAGTQLIEWTGIQKTRNDDARLVVATSAAEVGLDLPFREVHTEFWGNSWEVSSISEWRVAAPLEKREHRQRYEGKKDQKHRRCYW